MKDLYDSKDVEEGLEELIFYGCKTKTDKMVLNRTSPKHKNRPKFIIKKTIKKPKEKRSFNKGTIDYSKWEHIEEEEEEEADEDDESASDYFEEVYAKIQDLKESGNMHYKNGQYEMAILDYTKAIELCKDDSTNQIKSTLKSNRSFCYMKLNKIDEALDDCNDAISLNPQNYKAYWRRTDCYISQKKYKEALEDCEELKRHVDSNPKAIRLILGNDCLQLIEEKIRSLQMKIQEKSNSDPIGSFDGILVDNLLKSIQTGDEIAYNTLSLLCLQFPECCHYLSQAPKLNHLLSLLTNKFHVQIPGILCTIIVHNPSVCMFIYENYRKPLMMLFRKSMEDLFCQGYFSFFAILLKNLKGNLVLEDASCILQQMISFLPRKMNYLLLNHFLDIQFKAISGEIIGDKSFDRFSQLFLQNLNRLCLDIETSTKVLAIIHNLLILKESLISFLDVGWFLDFYIKNLKSFEQNTAQSKSGWVILSRCFKNNHPIPSDVAFLLIEAALKSQSIYGLLFLYMFCRTQPSLFKSQWKILNGDFELYTIFCLFIDAANLILQQKQYEKIEEYFKLITNASLLLAEIDIQSSDVNFIEKCIILLRKLRQFPSNITSKKDFQQTQKNLGISIAKLVKADGSQNNLKKLRELHGIELLSTFSNKV